ncbi:acyl-CoA dehydrogenase family protein [Phytohabitans kaempferiae]|uniref:Acyl-CoA dehydrogenase family protein n=1 Tax=Phytohabitans kaempferiae TaxID=1620943 RepID=A0ABV6MGX6_9ACTN
MTFVLSEEQAALRESLRDILSRHAPLSRVRAVIAEPHGYDEPLWRRLVEEIGVCGIGVPEEYGGAGEGFCELAVVMGELGRSLTPVPFLSSSILAIRTLLATRDAAACERWVPPLVTGDVVGTLAVLEQGQTWGAHDPKTVAVRAGKQWRLDGVKSYVTDALAAEFFVVLAEAPDGPTLFAVRRGEGVDPEPLQSIDPTRPQGRLVLRQAAAEVIGTVGAAGEALGDSLVEATIALACEQTGAAERCLEFTVDYAKTRTQFGQPIGSFQSIKHILADRFLANTTATAIAYGGAWAVDHDPTHLGRHASLAKAYASQAFVETAKASIQIHGGIGYTWEHDAHLYLKRALSTNELLGAPRHHRALISASLLDQSSEVTCSATA